MDSVKATNESLHGKNSPAFGHGDHTHGGAPGLTKREYIAAQVMSGLTAYGPVDSSRHAELAVECADALLAALLNPKDNEDG